MDLIAQALIKRDNLKRDLGRVETFLSIAYELQGEGHNAKAVKTDAEKIAEPIRRVSDIRAPSGVGAKTAETAESIVREARRPMTTRELLPLIQAHGIEVSGQDMIATLSARLGNDAKRADAKMRLVGGKWHLLEWISKADSEETAGSSLPGASTVSSFHFNQGERRDAAALAD